MVGLTGMILRALLLGSEALLALPLLYLLVLSGAALVGGWQARRPSTMQAAHGPTWDQSTLPSGRPRFAVLIPAHDEELVIGGVLASVAALDYPAAWRDVYVIADNCTDATAEVAREAGVPGVQVCERRDERQRSKGHALRWLLEELERSGQRYDGYVVVDADSRLSPNFLSIMAAGLHAGAEVLQGQYRVENAADSWTSGLRAVAFALFNHLRPLGRSVLGWSAGLKGNGMCFSRSVMERFGWASYSLAEDAEYHLALVGAGVRVAYVPAAVVSSAMPTNLRLARTQQQRWEHGRLVLARAHAGKLLRGALRYGDLARLDAIVEVCLPPLSLLVGVLGMVVLVAVGLRWEPGLWVAGLLALALALHGLAGMALARLSLRAYGSLVYAPWYVLWKIGIYTAAALRKAEGPWVRTSRAS